MTADFDFMVPEDRAEKIAIYKKRRDEWIKTRSDGLARFVLLRGLPRSALVIVFWDVFYWAHLHVSVAMVARVTVFMLLLNPVFNLLEWYWNERRYREDANESVGSKSGVS